MKYKYDFSRISHWQMLIKATVQEIAFSYRGHCTTDHVEPCGKDSRDKTLKESTDFGSGKPWKTSQEEVQVRSLH